MRPHGTRVVLLIVLLTAVSALLPVPAEAATRQCDRRLLPKADTLAVEAAAREAAQGKLPDMKVEQSCITTRTTSVTLSRPNPTDSTSRREQWRMDCSREPSTWAKRGNWICGTPRLTRDMDAKATFLGRENTLFIRFDSTLSFETAEALARRTLELFEEPAPKPCKVANARDWKVARQQVLSESDASTLHLSIDTSGGGKPVTSFEPFPLAFLFEPDAVADPAHAPACWFEQVFLD